MNIGVVTYFAFRPHTEHMFALSKIIEEAGHNVYSLSCDGALTTCYKRELTKTSKLKECTKCTLGGLRSYPVANIKSARYYQRPDDLVTDESEIPQWGHSSACTVFRAETETEKSSNSFMLLKANLSRAAWQSYKIASRWIDDKKLDAIVCFNGRMEATRGVLEAAKAKNIRYVSVERSWGHGLLLLPDSDCLGLQALHKMIKEYNSKPLTLSQAYKATQIVASRFLKKNMTEWRAYNLNSVDSQWPLKGTKKKILILPSSCNEYDGHADWRMQWKDQFDAFNNVINAMGLPIDCYVMRGHPNWSETIGATGGDTIQHHYEKWAKEKGIYYIPSKSNISTQYLIRQADVVILNGGSAAIEAGILGKPIISLIATPYQYGGFITNYLSPEDEINLDKILRIDDNMIRRMTIRFLYTWSFRFMQYTKDIRAIDSIRYTYSGHLNADKIMKIITTGTVPSDDDVIAMDEKDEAEILSLIKSEQWESIYNFTENSPAKTPTFRHFDRKSLFKTIGRVRALLPIGDR